MDVLAALALAIAALATFQAGNEANLEMGTFNIRMSTEADGPNRWEVRKPLAFEVIEQMDLDILGVQEALPAQMEDLLEAHPRYAAIGVGRDDGVAAGEYSAILFDRSRFTVASSGTIWLSDTPDVPGSTSWGNQIPRICTWGRLIDNTVKRPFVVYNCHFDHQSQSSRERSAEAMIEHRDSLFPDDLVVMMGDFNAGEDNPAVTTFLQAGLINAYRADHPTDATVGTFHGFRGGDEGAMIDYVFLSPAWEVIDAEIVRWNKEGRYPSDHNPVTAEVVWPKEE
ncbi:MAG: endonuclease/exonuclease/phosphatase family protein [Fimbriimonadaceae bacterium]